MLDETLVDKMRRKARKDELTLDERIALNLFWRRGVKVPILAKAFKISKNTIYYKALTGGADSYPNTAHSNPAAETNAAIERLGEDRAYKKYVTQAMIIAVNDEMARELERRRDSHED
jgi:hypothetical protein